MRPDPVTRFARLAFLIAVGVALTLMLGPFQNAERIFFLTDKEAHVLAFYVLTLLSFFAAPTMRKNDIAVAAIALAASVEVAQGVAGREVSMIDLGAGALGTLMAWAGAQAEVVRRRGAEPFKERRRPVWADAVDELPLSESARTPSA